MSHDINSKVQASRKELLDIGLRNNLINFRKTSKTLALKVDDIASVFEALYVDEKLMSFDAAKESGGARSSQDVDGELSEDDIADDALLQAFSEESQPVRSPKADERNTSLKLKTALSSERLFLQLLKMRSEAQGYIDEQGVNILFLAFGFLHWFEAPQSTEPRKAPILLVPVKLTRSSSNESFKLSYSGEDIFLNLSLEAKLRTDFDIKLPLLALEVELDAGLLLDYFKQVQKAIAAQKRWTVEADELMLGFFSFGKFLMFKDLDPQSWPEGKGPADHPVLSRLLRSDFGDQPPSYSDDVVIDDAIAAGEVHFVKDADSSQTQAILEVRAGSHLIIQGPPGTGKSQTITNLIAELISQDKTVLFVSEKMAALEVVKRRLDDSHLGDAVLELHSQRATKTSVLSELARTMGQGKPLNDKGQRDIEDLQRLQAQLNNYCSVVSSTVGASGVPFTKVLGRHLQLKREYPLATVASFAPMNNWTERDYLLRRELVAELKKHVESTGRPDRNPFWGTSREYFTPIDEGTANDALGAARTLLIGFQTESRALSERLLLSQPASLHDIDVVCRAARRAASAPKLQGIHLSTQDWQLRRDVLRELFKAGRRMSELKQQHAADLLDVAWEHNMLPIRQALMTYGPKWWKFMSGVYKQAKGELQSLSKTPLPKSPLDMLKVVDAVIDHQAARKVYDQHEMLGSALYGAQWQRQQSDWDVLERITDWVMTLHDDLGSGEIPPGIIGFLSGNSDASGLGEMAGQIETSIAKMKAHLEAAAQSAGMGTAQDAFQVRTAPLEMLSKRLDAWIKDISLMYPMVRFNGLASKMKREELTAIAEVAAGTDDPALILASYDQTWYTGLVQQVYTKNPTLQQFDRIQHEHLIERFKALDTGSMKHAQAKLAAHVWQRKPALNQPGEMAIIRTEINKKRRHLPIRQLIERAGRAVQQIKPIFMMSPMSIANFLPPGKIEFDIVIFDEASQVKAVDALGAILRAKQVVVVGDTRQMPPTDFFAREIEFDDENNETSDIESILSLFKAAGCHECYLRWHYRSQHESLIAVSNAEFYDNKLVIFPSAGTNKSATGIHFHHLPDALYDRGRTRTNREEAKAVAAAVMKHAEENPHMSLGVAAFSVAQRDLIEVEVEMLRRRNPLIEAFFSAHPSEPFFVKNLENIQGDERDTIFISVGYGRNESGRIAKEFGPLNRDGGHRRLNVLITRAKMQMRVFCNFTADELELDAGTKHGVRALKNFLKYAETRVLEVSKESGKATDSPFEDEVLTALKDLGYLVEPQVGTAGYFIDLAVKDPERPGRYILAIECDGASYHSSRSARDRDRLRQGVLEGLGWRFHRIWSTDWFRNRQQEISRMIEAIELAKRNVDDFVMPNRADIRPTEEPYVIVRGAPASPEVKGLTQPYRRAQLPRVTASGIVDASTDVLANFVCEILEVEGAVHISDITKRLMDAFGVARAGSRIAAKVDEVVNDCRRRSLAVVRGDFVYRPGNQPIQIRDRSAMDSTERKIELVPPEEIDRALQESVRIGFSMPIGDCVPTVVGLLGFGRATQRIAGVVQQRMTQLIKDGILRSEEGVVTLGSSAELEMD
jgi:very-short-patch-repair endonuclease/DNA polymerase III delta prime subunit